MDALPFRVDGDLRKAKSPGDLAPYTCPRCGYDVWVAVTSLERAGPKAPGRRRRCAAQSTKPSWSRSNMTDEGPF